MTGKHTIDRAVTVLAALSAPVLTLLVDQHVLSAGTAADVAGIVAAAIASYHGGAAAQRRQARTITVTVPAQSVPGAVQAFQQAGAAQAGGKA